MDKDKQTRSNKRDCADAEVCVEESKRDQNSLDAADFVRDGDKACSRHLSEKVLLAQILSELLPSDPLIGT